MALSLHRMSAKPYGAAVFLCVGLLVLLYGGILSPYRGRSATASLSNSWTSNQALNLQPGAPIEDEKLPCYDLPGAEDVVVVLKTGSTEFADKFPVHINTTLRCCKNYLVFSDYEETYEDIHVIDSFEFTADNIKEKHADFALWRRLRESGRAGLSPGELSGQFTAQEVSKSGKAENTGWNLDKWKFLPMVNRTLHEFPDKKWYLFVEVDTSVMWQTLLNYLQALDSSKPLYVGDIIHMEDVYFAHGGTGYVLSQPALQDVVKMYEADQTAWDEETDDIPYGDALLGMALNESGANFIHSYPIFQGEQIGAVRFGELLIGEKNVWCSPAVTYHHQSPPVVSDLWHFEQQWMQEHPGVSLRHRDLFRKYILPRIPDQPDGFTKLGWTYHADTDRGFVESLNACREICVQDDGCVQYLIDLEQRCKTAETPSLGEWARGIDSGWVRERVLRWDARRPHCSGEDWWITS